MVRGLTAQSHGMENETQNALVPFRREATPDYPAAQRPKPTYWQDRAAGMFLGFEIIGSGPFVFVSKCTRTAYLFPDAATARAQKCEAGADCKLFGCHSRHLLKWIAPLKTCWEKD